MATPPEVNVVNYSWRRSKTAWRWCGGDDFLWRQNGDLLQTVEQLQTDEVEIAEQAEQYDVRDAIVNCSCEAAQADVELASVAPEARRSDLWTIDRKEKCQLGHIHGTEWHDRLKSMNIRWTRQVAWTGENRTL